MSLSNTQKAFFELVRAGLWEKEVRLMPYQDIDLGDIYKFAEEQSVVGLVTAGLEHVKDIKLPKEEVLAFIGAALQLEQRNKEMNQFVAVLIDKLRKADIYTLLVKGQGVAQCYERPLWRASGDIDLLLSKTNYLKSKDFLIPEAKSVEVEDKRRLHYGMCFDQWEVELHGTLHTEISSKMNIVIDEVQQSIFYEGNVRSWQNGGIQVFLPSPDNDVIIIFTHFIDHFYGEGVGLRQICDWCRLLWTYKESLNHGLLESRIRKMGLMSEWKAFAAFAVDHLGMPVEAMPFYTSSNCYKKKASKICQLVLVTGNFGHNKDNSYRVECSKMTSNFITFFRRMGEFARLSTIFPWNAPKFFITYSINRFMSVI